MKLFMIRDCITPCCNPFQINNPPSCIIIVRIFLCKIGSTRRSVICGCGILLIFVAEIMSSIVQNKKTMKRTLFIMSLVASSVISIAQKGNWYVGGVVGFATNSAKAPNGFKTTATTWAFAPEAGTFLKDDIQLGLALGLSGSSDKNDNAKIQTSTNFSPTAYARKFFKITDNFSAFGGFYLNFFTGTTTSYTSTPSVKSTDTGIGLRLGVGIAYALSPRFTALGQYGLMGFQTVSSKVGGSSAGSDTSFNFGVNTVGSSSLIQGNGSGAVFNIGLYYTFKKAS